MSLPSLVKAGTIAFRPYGKKKCAPKAEDRRLGDGGSKAQRQRL